MIKTGKINVVDRTSENKLTVHLLFEFISCNTNGDLLYEYPACSIRYGVTFEPIACSVNCSLSL